MLCSGLRRGVPRMVAAVKVGLAVNKLPRPGKRGAEAARGATPRPGRGDGGDVMDLTALQNEHAEWMRRNFPDREPWMQLVGVQEELGELSHAHLKMSQKIRGTEEHHRASARDAIGDIVIFLAGYCTDNGYDLGACVRDAWIEVKKRDWQKNKKNGCG